MSIRAKARQPSRPSLARRDINPVHRRKFIPAALARFSRNSVRVHERLSRCGTRLAYDVHAPLALGRRAARALVGDICAPHGQRRGRVRRRRGDRRPLDADGRGLSHGHLWRCRTAQELPRRRRHRRRPVRAAGNFPPRIRPAALPRVPSASAARLQLLERHLHGAARARLPDPPDGGLLARLDGAVLCGGPAGAPRGPLRARANGRARQQGRARRRPARVPDRQRRGHFGLRAALSAVEFRAAYGRRRAADAARTRSPRARSVGRRSKPTCARRSRARARCAPMRSSS